MANLSLSEIAEKMNGKILQGLPSLSFNRFNIDSRLTEPGEMFIALVAKRNGHDFVPEAIQKGALGVVASQKVSIPNNAIGLIEVDDTLLALGELARKVLSEHEVKVIGITGSIGKTSTKEFTSSLLSPKFNVLKSEGNFNNQLGLPLSLLRLKENHQAAVLEMAMSAPGEISQLARIAPPNIAVITNIQPVHLEFFKSMDDIALAKKEILIGAKENGTAVLNGDDALVKKIAEDWKGEKIFFGLSPECDIQAHSIQMMGFKGMSFELKYGQQQEKVHFPFFYESHLFNLLTAAGVAFTLSVPFEDVLEQTRKLKPFARRGTLFHLKRDIVLIDDSYNSNPAALESVLKGLASLPSKRKVAILGDMLELGENEIDFHIQTGKQIAGFGWGILITVGSLSQHMIEGALSSGMKKEQTLSFEDSVRAAEEIWSLLEEGDLVLVKGSRKIKTEKIVEKIRSEGL
ncbi:MAG: UDP-N-acetylmuramoyl-tripeptide--D-alanyl-D-alanine ligase [Candidatus Aminicenantes bacterium]|nr:MAG: UDP-N-acetylmuramoyl-tripeptide--D-alanyl-D-alanine ligase [Candidatus Aminicenantes bacterium]